MQHESLILLRAVALSGVVAHKFASPALLVAQKLAQHLSENCNATADNFALNHLQKENKKGVTSGLIDAAEQKIDYCPATSYPEPRLLSIPVVVTTILIGSNSLLI